MPKRQSRRTQALGDDYLPDLILKMPLHYPQALPEILVSNTTAAYLIDEATRTSRQKESASSSITLKVHPEHCVNLLAYDSTPRNSAAWPDLSTSPCASCSKWSLACIHAAALNAFDEHDSDSDQPRHATGVMQRQMMVCLRNGSADLEDAARRSQHPERVNSPMLHQWLAQSPRQEAFNGIVAAQTRAAGAARSRL